MQLLRADSNWSGAAAAIVAAAVAIFFVAPASATPVAGGTCHDPGADVQFVGISSTANFGAGECIGNTLDYDPFNFRAQSNGAGAVNEVGQLVFTIQKHANSNTFIEELRIRERGDYSLDSTGTGTTDARVDLIVFITINATQFGAPLVSDSDQQTASFSAPPDAVAIWTLGTDLDITQILIDAGVFNQTGFATEVEINNILNVEASTGNSALIEKKDFKGFVITVVPEPGTFALLSLGLMGLVWQGRRRY
jgi:hypothetical protein